MREWLRCIGLIVLAVALLSATMPHDGGAFEMPSGSVIKIDCKARAPTGCQDQGEPVHARVCGVVCAGVVAMPPSASHSLGYSIEEFVGATPVKHWSNTFHVDPLPPRSELLR